MSTSEDRPDRFDRWLAAEYESLGDFTVLVVLVHIGEISVSPVRSTFMNVIGTDTGWREMAELFHKSGAVWNGAAFFPLEGLVPSPSARIRLAELEERLREDRRILNDGHFFDAKGRRLRIDEISRH